MKIITISREFGSGGRELGRSLADMLHMDYYDREIISAIVEKTKFDEKYVENILKNGTMQSVPITFGRTFSYSPVNDNVTKILVSQHQIIKEIGAKGRDCVIVGRSADVLLEEYNPVNIFVYADMASKIKRCRERAADIDKFSDRELEKKIKQIDSNRAKSRELVANSKWGRKESYHLCINTTGLNINDITPVIAEYARFMFGRTV